MGDQPQQQPLQHDEQFGRQHSEWLEQQLQQMYQQGRSREASGQAVVTRLVDDGFAYLKVDYADGQITLCFTADRIDGYLGESWEELDVSVGSLMDVEWNTGTGIVTRVRPVSAAESSDLAGTQ